MLELNADESRVLGVLIEKATTTPEQYPLSLNAIVNGANQKNNRDPVRSMTEDECFDATASLRGKGLVTQVDQMGSRVPKFRHNAGEVLHARTGELAILAELLLRGPQTIGELRGRASRMSPMETLEVATGLVNALINRPEPMAREIPPSPGSRAVRFVQLLCPDLHSIDAAAIRPSSDPSTPGPSATPGTTLAERVTQLENQVTSLKSELSQIKQALGL
jgi:uncharacterized protein YceH (UPF0502 family)